MIEKKNRKFQFSTDLDGSKNDKRNSKKMPINSNNNSNNITQNNQSLIMLDTGNIKYIHILIILFRAFK